MVTDGNNSGVDGSVVVLKARVQTVTIDLKAPHTIYAILMWRYLKEARAYKSVVVQVAGAMTQRKPMTSKSRFSESL